MMTEKRPMKSLLFIDDNADLLNVWKKYFTSQKFRVLTAASGEEGLKIADREKPDLILLDLKMPGWDGVETLNLPGLKAGE